jgi:hypothetical protein
MFKFRHETYKSRQNHKRIKTRTQSVQKKMQANLYCDKV